MTLRLHSEDPRHGASDGERWASITRTPLRFIVLLTAILSVVVAIAAHGAEQHPVRMTLQSVNLTNSPWQADYSNHCQAMVFVVTNGGAKRVRLICCGASFLPTNIPGLMPLYGVCSVPPFTNSALTVLWTPDRVGTQWIRYAVFESADAFWKAATTARAMENGVLGKFPFPSGWLTNIWTATNRWIKAYEITSPPFATSPQPLLPPVEVRMPEWVWSTNGWIRGAEIEPLFPAGEAYSARRRLDGISDGMDLDVQPTGPANRSQPIRSETNGTSSAAGSRR
jgi:hypothetical protein